jgi:hypothetical protein
MDSLGAFAKLRKENFNFISVCPFARLPRFSWNLIFVFFRKSFEKIHILLKSSNNKGHFEWKNMFVYGVSRILVRRETLLKMFKLNILLTVHHIYQYSETNVMHFLFILLRIKGFYMFRALLTHPQEAMYKRHDDCNGSGVPLQSWQQPTDITRTQYTKCRLWSTS